MRFAVLHHLGWPEHADHYDLLLQTAEGRGDNDTVLKAFGSLAGEFPAPPCQMRLLPDHRRLYLTYEGPVAGGRGSVQRVDEGHLVLMPAQIKYDWEMRFQLSGLKLNGNFILRRVTGEVYVFETVLEPTRNKDDVHA